MLSREEEQTSNAIGNALRTLKSAKSDVGAERFDKGTQSAVQSLSFYCMELARALGEEAYEIEAREDFAGDYRAAMQYLADAARFAKTQTQEQCRAAIAFFDCALHVAGQAIAARLNRESRRA
jgi:hypothetical protein